MTNIFEIIEKVTSRIEPFHSEFLTSVLREDRTLLGNFLQLVFPKDNNKVVDKLMESNRLEIISEDSFSDFKRIDILIKEPGSKYIIGIEVKTTDSSVRSNQMEEYYERLIEKYSGFKVLLVFLTPFNSKNLPNEVSSNLIAAINEFDLFSLTHKNAVHINWDKVVDLYENTVDFENNIFLEHRNYIKTRVTNPSRLITRILNVERNRGLSDFFGVESIGLFYEKLSENKIDYFEDEQKIQFKIADNTSNFDGLIGVFKTLIESDKLQIRAQKINKIDEALLQKYKIGNNGEFFTKFFSVIDTYSYLWMQGEGRIGIRTAHKSHKSSGVSVFTIDEDSIIIRKIR